MVFLVASLLKSLSKIIDVAARPNHPILYSFHPTATTSMGHCRNLVQSIHAAVSHVRGDVYKNSSSGSC
jgi:hypothetical protein